MEIRPELEMLRSNDAPQRSAQQALADIAHAWRLTGDGATVEAELVRFHRGERLERLPLLGALFAPQSDRVRAFLDGLLQPLLAQIGLEPLGQSPLRYSTSDAATGIVLARCATSALILHYTSGPGFSRQPAAQTAGFLPAETWERVLAGSAEATRVRLAGTASDRADLRLAAVRLQAGDVRHRHGRDEALVLRAVPTSLVQLRLQRRSDEAQPVRHYRLSDGQLVHQAAGTPRDSRLELSAALLGRMKRRDAAPVLSAMVKESGSDALRWQILRECLALDTATGFRALCSICDRAADPLNQHAATLRATLLARHPSLKDLMPCPA